ncbi:MAG: hypothetical protein U1E39_04630 [Planctomycetota bacterium]
MPRPRILPTDDALLTAAEAGALVHVSRSRWDAYWRRYEALVRGRRIVRANPNGKGVSRWLKSAVIHHMHCELASDRDATSEVAEAGGVEVDEQVAP